TVDQALDEVQAGFWRRLGPVTLVDVDDIVGAGAPGGSTYIVRALVQNPRDLDALVPVHDPALVEELWSAPLGSRHHVTLRGTPGYGAPPVEMDGVLAARTTNDAGRVVRLDVG